ncbi:GumC family protein [Pseudomonas chlororaphis]|uniref:GumC family protein n=1 Tax=Pseudomonas chlororaphis TaxID=587753 RepID=UPI0015E04407|nr:lipopolysaccharide biosynthesis protein [Pseudomonas chlororaphis]QLL10826.1 lipopolysaccharide biosynthesis protein [Pseudomonas chlororaphis subsp. aurantiaca]
MNRIENYLHEFLLVFFVNRRLIKRVFLGFAVIALLLPLVLRQSYEITAEVIVQSKKLSQSDANTVLTPDSDKFIPPSLADMETESNILRSPTLIRETIGQLREAGEFGDGEGLLARLLFNPLRDHVTTPLRAALGLKIEPVRDTALDAMTNQAVQDLKIATLPGSNVISVVYASADPTQGTRFVERLLANYLKNRQDLQSNELPQTFFEQKKVQYQERLDDLEGLRQALLEAAHASDPKEEITFRLNAINTEEQSLNGYRDQALENQRRLDYLQNNLKAARKGSLTDYTFPFAFANTVDNVAYEDREIKQLGEQLTNLVSQYGTTSDTYRADSVPMQQQREQIVRARAQFLKVVENRVRERTSDLQITNSVIAQKTARINEYKTRVRDLQEVLSKLRQLDTEIDALHKAFFTYTQRYEESRGERLINGELSNARVLSQPYEPSEAAFPKPMLIIPLGLLTGLLLAIALGYVYEFFDHRFKHPAQVGDHLNLPVLMVLDAVQAPVVNPYPRWTWQWLWHWAKQ